MKKSFLLLIPSLFLVASCGGSQDDPSPAPVGHEHTYAEEWTTNESQHWHAATCGHDVKGSLGRHVDDDKDEACDYCGYEMKVTPIVDPCPEGQCVDNDEDGKCDVCGYPVQHKHAKTVKGDPAASFYLKVGEQRKLTATLDPMPDRQVEKTFTWTSSNPSVASVVETEGKDKEATATGLKTGHVTFTAQNDYSSSLKREFLANVIDYDEANMYLWEYTGTDKAQFGYTNDNKAGDKSGTAKLGDLSWEFERSKVSSINLTNSGMIGFGKGEDPETTITLVNRNTRNIKKIEIETCSANGLANIEVKVGDNVVIDKATPSSSEELPPAVSSGDLENLTGDITITFETPAMDDSKKDDPSYKKPGAVYLKSMWITYGELSFKSEKTYDFVEMFNDPDSQMSQQITSTTGKACSIEDDDYSIKFDRVRKSDDKGNLYFESNSPFTVTSKKTDEVIKAVEFNWVPLKDGSTDTISIKSSFLGNDIFTDTSTGSKTGNLSVILTTPNVKEICVSPSNSDYVGLKSIAIKTIEGEHLNVSGAKFAEGAVPAKTEYFAGEAFDPAGLGDLIVSFSNEGANDARVSNSFVTFYDGPSYDKDEKTTALNADSTYVVGLFLDFEIKVEGITVKNETVKLTLVKDVSEIDIDSTYFITSPENHAISLGTSGNNMTKAVGCKILSDVDFLDEVDLSALYKNDGYKLIKNDANGLYQIKAIETEYLFGITNTYKESTAKTPPFNEWSIAIDSETGLATISINPADDVVRYLTCSGTIIKPYETDKANMAIYKLAD